jgi:hypothetical protein
VRLLRPDSPEVVGCLASNNRVLIRRPWADFRDTGFIPYLPVLLLVACWVSGQKVATILAAALLIAWICFLLWRAASSKQHWIMVGCREHLYFRLYRPFRENLRLGPEPASSILALEGADVRSISRQIVDAFIPGPDPKVAESLVVQLEPQAQNAVNEEFERLSPSVSPYDADKLWFVRWSAGSLVIQWRRYHPGLMTLMSIIIAHYPSIAVAPESRSELDLSGFARKPALEQQRLLVEAKSLGFGADCIEVVMSNPYKRRSMAEAIRYISEARVDSEPPQGKTEL